MLKKTLALVGLTLSLSTNAADINLDQSNLAAVGAALAIVEVQSVAQTFTAGLNGTLSQVDLVMYAYPEATVGFSVSLYAGGSPASVGSALFSQSYPETYLPSDPLSWQSGSFVAFDVSSAGIRVNVGDELTIMVTRRASANFFPDWVLWTEGQDYTRGEGYHNCCDGDWTEYRSDLAFQTYVSKVPVPAAAWLFGSALVGLAGIKRKK